MVVPLLVCCDEDDGLAVALASGADALVFDLDRAGRPAALAMLERARASATRPRLVLRVAGLDDPDVDAALDGAMVFAPDAVLLAGAVGAAGVRHLSAKLAVLEAEHGLADRRTAILAAAADTPRGVLALDTIPRAGPRLEALVWEGEPPRGEPARVARALLAVAAAAARVPAIDAASEDGGEALLRECAAARRDGFAGKLARRAAQVPLIRSAFARRA